MLLAYIERRSVFVYCSLFIANGIQTDNLSVKDPSPAIWASGPQALQGMVVTNRKSVVSLSQRQEEGLGLVSLPQAD